MSLLSQQPAPAPAPVGAPDDRATEFKAVEGGEHFNGSTLMVEAYAAIWMILMAWILFLWRKQATMSVRLDDLERTLDRAAAAKSGAEKPKEKPKAKPAEAS